MAKRFGQLLKKYRRERGFSQWELYGELAERSLSYTGVRGGSIISRWEGGQRNPPSYETILVLEEILGVQDSLLASAAGYPSTRSKQYERGRGQPRLSDEVEPKIDVDAIVLVPELERRHKTYILYKWCSLDIEEITKKLGISSESFWRDIDETEKEGGGKMELKEFTAAHDVSWLMSRFLSCLRSPDPCRILPVSTEQIELYETSWVEEQPLFPELKRLLGNEFCGKFNDWKKVRGRYFGKCLSFLGAVHQKAEQESQMRTTEYGEEWGLNDVFSQRIYSHILLKTKPQPLTKLDSGYLKNLDATEFAIQDNNLIVKRESTALAKGEPPQLDHVSKAYWSLVAGFTSASEPKQIWALWQELGTIEKPLNAQAGAVYDEIISKWFRYRDTVLEI